MLKTSTPLVTCAVPVCGTTQAVLDRCLQSLCTQDFTQLEIIIVDDNDTPRAQRECRSFVKQFCKKNKSLPLTKNIVYINHEHNLGLFEARRTGIEHAHGKYLMMVDSDDALTSSDAVSTLYNAAITAPADGFDLVQCGCVFTGSDEKAIAEKHHSIECAENPVVRTIWPPVADLSSLFYGGEAVSEFLWAKLFKTQCLLDALQFIPNMYCVMTEDRLFSYFFSRSLKSYTCIPQKLYAYTVNEGISSNKKIMTLENWQKHCSAASVYTAIMYDIQERPFPEGSVAHQILSERYLKNCISQAISLKQCIDKSIYDEARSMFIEAWGEPITTKAMEIIESGSLVNRTKS